MRLFKNLKLFFQYRKAIINNREYLLEKHGLEYNLFYELYTTIVLTDAPKELKEQYGAALYEHEIKKYRLNFAQDCEKLDLYELIKIYEIKKISDDVFGIAFGFSLIKNRTLILSLIITTLLLITTGILIIL